MERERTNHEPDRIRPSEFHDPAGVKVKREAVGTWLSTPWTGRVKPALVRCC